MTQIKHKLNSKKEAIEKLKKDRKLIREEASTLANKLLAKRRHKK
jgi:vacuolar-type H+-ATPase subunit H